MKTDSAFNFDDAIILASGIGMLILVDNMKWQRWVTALEDYLSESIPKFLGNAVTEALSVPRTELEACGLMLKTHLSRLVEVNRSNE